jgi:hypothetical protein
LYCGPGRIFSPTFADPGFGGRDEFFLSLRRRQEQPIFNGSRYEPMSMEARKAMQEPAGFTALLAR